MQFFPSLKMRQMANSQRYTTPAIFANPLTPTNPEPSDATSLFRLKISLFLGQNSLIPVLEFPVNFTGIWGTGGRNPRERRDLSG